MNLTERQIRGMRMCDLNPSYIQEVKWKYFDEIGYKPHAGGQREYHMRNERFRVVAAGTRWGKSMSAGNEYAGWLMLAPFPLRFWVVAPSYDLGAKEFEYIWRGLIETMKMPTKKANFNIRSGHMVIETEWGSWIRVRSAKDEDLLYGEELDGIILSEASKIPSRIYQRVIRGRLTSRLGRLDIPTTPKGKNNFVHKLWLMGQDPEEEDYWSCLHPSEDNPHLDEKEIKEAKKTLDPRIYAEQYGGEFISLSGNVFSFTEANIVDEFKTGLQTPPDHGAIFRMIDFGFRNPFCCLSIWVEPLPGGLERHWVFDEQYIKETLMSEHAKIMKEKARKYEHRIECTFYDPHGVGGQSAAELQAHGINGLVPTLKGDEYEMVDRVRYMLETEVDGLPLLVFMRHCFNSIDEHRNAEWEENTARIERNDREMIKKYKNHSVDCILYFEHMRNFVQPAISIEGEPRKKHHLKAEEEDDSTLSYKIRQDEGAQDFLVQMDDPAYMDSLIRPFGAQIIGYGYPGGCKNVDGNYVIRINADRETVLSLKRIIQAHGSISEELKGVLV